MKLSEINYEPIRKQTNIEDLKKSISTIGLINPLTLDANNLLLAGRRRYQAVKELGWTDVDVRIIDTDGDLKAMQITIDENLRRRNLSDLEVAAQIKEYDELKRKLEGSHPVGKHSSLPQCGNDGWTQKKTAKDLGISQQAVAKALKIAKAVEEYPELAGHKKGSVILVEYLKKRREKEVITQPEKPTIKKAECLDYLSGIDNQSIDLLLTDPPYSTDVEDIEGFSSWILTALQKVKPSGRAYVFIGAYPQEILAYLQTLQQSNFTLANILVWTYRNTIGPQPQKEYKLNWQAVLYLYGHKAGALNCPIITERFSVHDINAPDGRLGDRFHTWQKPDQIAERFILHSTKKGDIILDCFAGTGTFLLAAARLGRQGIGCENSDEMLDIAKSRGCNIE